MAGFDIEGARKAGASDAQIADFLAKQTGFKLDEARKAGASDGQVADFLSKQVQPTEEKPKPKEEAKSSFGDKALDYLNSGVVGPVVNTVAGLPRALEAGVRNLPRMGLEALQTNNMSGPGFTGALAKTALQAGENLVQGKPAGVSENFVSNIVGTKEQRQKDLDQKIALDRAISSVPHIPGTEEAAEYGIQKQKELNESVTPEAKQAMEASQPSGNLLEAIKTGSTKNLSFGKDPSLYGYSLNATQALGSLVPVIATALLTKKIAPGAQSAAVGTVGYGQGAGESIQSAKEYVANMDDATLTQSSPYYKKMIEDGVSPEEARKVVSDRAAEYAGQLQGAVSAFGGEVTGKLITGGFDKVIDKYAKNRLAKIALGTAASTTEEGTEEFVEGIASDIGINKAVVKEIGADSFANFVLGALGGAPVGAVSGARAKSETDETTPPPPPSGQQTQTTNQTQTTSSAFTDDELNESETGKTVGVTSQDNDIDQILEGAEIVGANGTSTGSSFKIVKPGRGKSAKGTGTTNVTGVDGTGATISSTDAGAQGEQSPLNEIEQNLIAKMQESGSEFKDVNHVKNWVKKHIFKGDLDGTNQLQQNNPDIFKRLLGEHKTQVTQKQEQADKQDENHLVDLEDTQNIVEKKKKKEPKNKKVNDAQELLSEATETDDPIVKKVKVKKAKEKVEGAKPQEIPGFEYYEETDANGTVTSGYRRKEELTEAEKGLEEKLSADPEAQEVLSKTVNDPNTSTPKKTLAQKFLHPYLLLKSKDAAHAPKDMKEAIATAAAEDAMDELALIHLTDRDEALEAEAKASNEIRQKEFDEKVQKLVEERGLSVEKARREIGGFKKTKYSKKHIIAHKGEDTFHEFSKQFVDEEEEKAQQEPAKKAEIDVRKSFIASLTKKQKAEFDKARKNFIAQDHRIRAQRTYTRGTTTGLQTTKVKDKKREPNKLGLEGLAEFVEKNPDIKWMDKPVNEKATPAEGPEALKDDDYFKTYMAKVKRHITKQKRLAQDKKSKKEQAKYASELEESKTAPLSAKAKLAANIEEAIRAGKTAAEILSVAAGKLQNRMFTSQFISSHYANLLKRIKADVKIVYGVVEDGRPGKFDPVTNTITINEEYSGPDTLDETLNHEVTHYLMDHLVDHPSMLSEIQKQALNSLRLQYKQIKTILSKQKFEINGVPVSKLISNLKEFNAMIMGSKEFQIAVGKIETLLKSNLSEQEFNEALAKLLNKIDTTEDTTNEEENIKPIAKEVRGSIFSRLSKTIAKMLGFSTLSADMRKELFEAGHSRDEVNRISNRDSGRLLQQVINNIQLMITPKIVNGKPVTEETVDGVTSIVGYQAPSGEFRGKKVSYAPGNRPRRKAPARPRTPDEIAIEEAERVQSDLQESIAFVKGAIALVLDPRNTYRFLVKHFQNSAAPLKLWQKNMDLKGQTKRDLDEVDANGKPAYNHVYELLQTMFAKADSRFYEECGELSDILTKQLKEIQDLFKFSVIPNKKGLTKFAKTLGKLDSYLKAMHEPERRRILFLKNLKLRDDIQIQLPNGFVGTPANIKARIFETLDKRGLSEAQAKNLRNLLDSLVFANKGDLNATLAKDRVGTLNMNLVDQAYYIGQNKQYLLDENNQEYSPVNEIQPIEVDMIRGQLENDPVIGPKVKEIFKTLQDIEAKSKVMYKEGNYWSPQVSNYINFYGFEHYVPYKGRPDLAMSKNDSLFYSKDDPLSKRFHEATKGMGGRASSGNNSIIQILMDAKKSSFSIYSNQVSVAMGNAIESGKIPTTTKDKKPYKSIKFENRETELTDEEIAKRNTIFVYRPDGVLDIYTIDNRGILESLRAPYKANQRSNWFMEAWASLTRMLGLNYTLFNLKFAAWNLARDVMTNLFALPIYHGYRAGAEYIYNVVKTATIDTVAGGGMFKAGRAMHLYQTKQMGELKRLAQSGDKFYKDFYDAEKSGGIVTFLQGVSSRGEIIDLSKKVGQGSIVSAGKLAVAVFQYWFNMFELTSKMSAWDPIKGALRRKFPNLPEKAIIEKAAYEIKSLANFEQTGTYGKELGTFYMFARAQATGAVTWIDAFSHVLPVEVAMTDLSKEDKANPQVVATYKENYSERAWRARILVALAIGAGYAIYGMSHMAADDDELDDNKISKDDPALWTRAARFTLPGADNKTVIQMPWGFGGGSLMALGSQMSILAHGNQTYGEFWGNLGQIMGDSYLPIPMSRISMTEHPMEAIYDTASPSTLRAWTEWVMNMDGLGHAIRQDESRSKMAKAFTGRGNTPEYIKNICVMLNRDFDIDISPNSVSFWMNSYFSAINQFATTVDNIRLVAEDEKQFDAKTDGIFVGSFLGKLPDHEAKEWVETSSAINKFIQMKNGKKIIGYDTDYLLKHPGLYDLIEKYDNDVNGRLKTLQEKANDIRNIQGSREYKDNELKYNNYEQRRLKKELIFMYKEMYPELKNEMDKKKDKENN